MGWLDGYEENADEIGLLDDGTSTEKAVNAHSHSCLYGRSSSGHLRGYVGKLGEFNLSAMVNFVARASIFQGNYRMAPDMAPKAKKQKRVRCSSRLTR